MAKLNQMQSYIRPVYEQFVALALMGIRAFDPYHLIDFSSLWTYQVLRKPV
ncbi:MAG: hypothetical protein ABIL62_06975 [Planctomycetota bacterium]